MPLLEMTAIKGFISELFSARDENFCEAINVDLGFAEKQKQS
jgi:hypothetical protein